MLDETDVKDSQGNVIIQPGLKVRHKESQFEYTIEDVVQGPDKEITVILRLPEEPRFTPSDAAETVLADAKEGDGMLYEADPDVIYFEPEEDSVMADELLAVPQKEFEKEYEVK